MRLNQLDKGRQKLRSLHSTAAALNNNARGMGSCWVKNLESLEHSLLTMRDELFGTTDREQVSVTGQILIENAAERATKLTKEAADFHKTLHMNISKVGKCIEKNHESYGPHFNVDCDLTWAPKRKFTAFRLIYDYTMTNGMNQVGRKLKQDTLEIEYPFDVKEPDTLQRIVLDLQKGEINSSLEYLERTRPPEEKMLRRSLQTQMITDSINTGLQSYDKTVRHLRKFKTPFAEDKERASRLIGAMLIGKPSKHDDRYRTIFGQTSRESISKKMTSFFVPYDAPLKNLLRLGYRNIAKISELAALSYPTSGMSGSELPIGTLVKVHHSAFACPILKEQCTFENPPMRLICGHVISRDAITRLTTSHRSNRTVPRHSRHLRFKCPYCPREQYMDNAREVLFDRWLDIECAQHEAELVQFYD